MTRKDREYAEEKDYAEMEAEGSVRHDSIWGLGAFIAILAVFRLIAQWVDGEKFSIAGFFHELTVPLVLLFAYISIVGDRETRIRTKIINRRLEMIERSLNADGRSIG